LEEKLKKRILLLIYGAVALIVIAVVIFGSFYTVSEQEQAVVTQFGKPVGTSGAGLHFKVPLVQEITNVDMTTRKMEFGYDSTTGASIDSESFMITKDFNFVNVDFFVEWKVSDPIKFLFNSRDPVGLMRNILQAEARSIVSGYNVDDVLTLSKVEIQTKIKDSVVNKIDAYDLGIYVSNITLQDSQPPTEEVVAAFKDVENAKQSKDTAINGANKYKNELIPQADAEADKIVKEAEGIKEARINEADGQVARFNEMYEEYSRNKDITKTRIYLETMEEVIPNMNVIIDSSGDDILKIMDLNNGEVSAQAAAGAEQNTAETEGGAN
jgi:membrane protease subunit HflK